MKLAAVAIIVIASVLFSSLPAAAQEVQGMGPDCCWNSGHSAASQYGYTPDMFRWEMQSRIKGGVEMASGYFYTSDPSLYQIEFEAYDQVGCENAFDTTYSIFLVDEFGNPVEFPVAYEATKPSGRYIDGVGPTEEPLSNLCWVKFTLVG